jgi:hypothetical protein
MKQKEISENLIDQQTPMKIIEKGEIKWKFEFR